MASTRQGAIRLFRVAGIDLFLHWSWFIVAAYEVTSRATGYSSFVWNVLEYVALFVIVMLHEFGHALACRSVGGEANTIMLWPLGGIAYVAPPPRPGATLWSIAAGPLVNVALLPFLAAAWLMSSAGGWAEALPNAYALVRAVCVMNVVLLVFNLLPIYPLDGGQILRSLLWFVVGRARSLTVVSMLGFVGVGGLFLAALALRSIWLGILGAFALMYCWNGLQQARLLTAAAKRPRRPGFACPACGAAPLLGAAWACGRCGEHFDTFATHAVCPRCLAGFGETRCPDCGASRRIEEWVTPGPTQSLDSQE